MDIVFKYLNREPEVTIQDLNHEIDKLHADPTLYDITEDGFDKLQVIFDFLENQRRPSSSVLKLLLLLNSTKSWDKRIEEKQQSILVNMIPRITVGGRRFLLKILCRSDFRTTTIKLLTDKIDVLPIDPVLKIYGEILYQLLGDSNINLDITDWINSWFDSMSFANCPTVIDLAHYYCYELSNTTHSKLLFWKFIGTFKNILHDFYNAYPASLGKLYPYTDEWMRYFEPKVRLKYLQYLHLETAPIEVEVSRGNILESCSQLMLLPQNMLRYSTFIFKFKGEDSHGLGVNHEFFTEFCREVCNNQYGLFKSLGTELMIPNDSSWMIHDNHLYYYEMVGRAVGIALVRNHTLDLPVSALFFKYLIDEPIDLEDLCAIDPIMYSSYKWMLDNDVSTLDHTFTITQDSFGESIEHELIANGVQTPVTNTNKEQFVDLAIQFLLKNSICMQIEALQKGFRSAVVIPPLTAHEMENQLCTLSVLCLLDWKTYSVVNGFTNLTPVNWFWEILEDFSEEERINLLQFSTGLRRLPQNKFSELVPAFTISEGNGNDDAYPTSNTCIHQLVIPPYTSKANMKEKLSFILTQNTSFGYL